MALLDQVYDTPHSDQHREDPYLYFDMAATMITASSPRFDKQKELLMDDRLNVQAFCVPAGMDRAQFNDYLSVPHPRIQFNEFYLDHIYDHTGGLPLYVD